MQGELLADSRQRAIFVEAGDVEVEPRRNCHVAASSCLAFRPQLASIDGRGELAMRCLATHAKSRCQCGYGHRAMASAQIVNLS